MLHNNYLPFSVAVDGFDAFVLHQSLHEIEELSVLQLDHRLVHVLIPSLLLDALDRYSGNYCISTFVLLINSPVVRDSTMRTLKIGWFLT